MKNVASTVAQAPSLVTPNSRKLEPTHSPQRIEIMQGVHKLGIRMKLAQTVKLNLASMGYRVDLRPFHKQQIWLLLERMLFSILQILYLIHEASTPRQYMEPIFMATAGILMYISLVSTIIEMPTIFKFIDNMQKVINGRLKYPRSKAMYKNANQIAEKWSKIINFLLVYITISAIMFPKAIISFFIYYTTDAGPNAFESSTPIWLPFDWKNPVGFLIAFAIQFRMLSFALRYLSYFLSLGVVFFVISLPIADDIVGDIRSLCEIVRFKHPPRAIHKQISELIVFMNQKELFGSFIRIYRITLIVLFLGSVGAICLGMLMVKVAFDQSNNVSDSMVLWATIFCGYWAFNLIFVTCELGQRGSNAFDKIGKVFAEIDWYLLPLDVQRMLPVIMIHSQEPIVLRFFGKASCSRKQFRMVINSGYKYFMVLRKFY